MTSKERILAAVNHIQPDRVPIGLRFAPELLSKLQNELNLNDREFWDWTGQDLMRVRPVFKNPASDKYYADPTIEITSEGFFLDIFSVPFKLIETQFQSYMDLAGRPPLQNCDSLDQLEAFPWPKANMWDYSAIRSTIDANRDKAACGHTRGFFEIAHFMRGMDNFLVDMALNPEMACSLMDHIKKYLLEKTKLALEAGGGQYTVYEYNDDIASQRGLFVSPDMWRQYIKPRMAEFCSLIHSYGAKVRYHSCGSVYKIIPDLIEIGVDILNPVQPLATDMDPFELKKQFGNRLSFHGGIDIQNLLPNASVEEVRSYVRRMIDIVGKDGGYILAGSHHIQADANLQNVIAMIEESKRL